MSCPRLEQTSAIFDGAAIDDGHIATCDECRAFVADASALRDVMVRQRDATFDVAPRRRRALWLVPAAAVLAIVIAFVTLRSPSNDTGAFAGFDPGKRAVITVKGRD
ncbi:MAG TPA: hypothetical protein VF787_19140 [Thermoanaerobaculia bacterium]